MPARRPPTIPAELHHALHRGERDTVVDLVLALSAGEQRRLRPAVRRHHDLVMSLPDGSQAADGEWIGPLRTRHQSAAAAALLGCSTLDQAVRYWPLDPPDSTDLPRLLFPHHLEAFVAEWSARYVRSPRAVDRVRGLEAMFDWAHEGLVQPPSHDGAVLLLASMGGTSGTRLLRYLEDRPVLIRTTMKRIFEVPGVPGASLAQIDGHQYRPGRRIADHVVPELVRRGHWDLEETRTAVARAVQQAPNGYQRRHMAELDDRLTSWPQQSPPPPPPPS